MKIFDNLNQWRMHRHTFSPTLSIGFVPTMGNLHQGHASLYQRSKEENNITVASLFVNPKQFNHASDFQHYPRTLTADIALLTDLHVDYCLLPTEQAMYPDDYCYQLSENNSVQVMEGLHRPGHFNGVLTVVMKLLNLVHATRAYFGEKDFQQYQLIRDMANAFFLTTAIVACPTIREKSGLAYSSRNNRLTDKQRQLADTFAHLFHQNHNSCADIINALKQLNIAVDYIEEHGQRRFAAVTIDGIRLIDNYAIK